MICIYCLHDKTTTPNSRPHKSRPVTWRRHRCPNCKGVFTTYERPSLEDMTIVADDQKLDPRMFEGNKVIMMACGTQHAVALTLDGPESTIPELKITNSTVAKEAEPAAA